MRNPLLASKIMNIQSDGIKEKGLLGPNPFKDYSFRRLTFLLREEECRTVYQQILQDQRSIFVHGSI